ncbi:hypothetical protein ACW9H7_02050 [Pseudomonas yamanorum]
MTFIAVISMDDCTVLAADRETFAIYSDGSSERAGPTARKITETASGYITASGWEALIEPVKERFKRECPADVGRMLSIIGEEQAAFERRDSNLAAVWIPKSTWKLSIPTGRGVVTAYYDYQANSMAGLAPGYSMMTFPSDVTTEEQEYVNSLLPKGQFLEPSELAISNAIQRVLSAVTYLRARGRSVSQEIDFAIHWGDEKSVFEMVAP